MKSRYMLPLAYMVLFIALVSFVFIFFKEEDKPKVVVVLKSLDAEYWESFKSGARKAFEDLDIDGKVIAPTVEYPVTKQIDMLKSVLGQNPDAIIVSPSHPPSAIPVLIEYYQKNIPVLIADTDVSWNGKTTFIGTDPSILGKTAGELLGSMLQPGDQVAFIRGKSMSSIMIDRINGAREALESIGIVIVTEQSGYDQHGKLKPVMGNILRNYPDLKGVFATTDVVALDALKVIKEKGLKIPVVGADGITRMVKSVEEGTLSATVAQNPYDIGYISVEQALKAINKETVAKRIDSEIDIITEDNAKDRLDFLEQIL